MLQSNESMLEGDKKDWMWVKIGRLKNEFNMTNLSLSGKWFLMFLNFQTITHPVAIRQ